MLKTKYQSLFLFVLVFCSLTLLTNVSAQAATFTVNNNADADDGSCTAVGLGNGCTLREALNAANADTAADIINFNIGIGTPTIVLASELPAIVNPVSIDGNTGGATRVELNGNSITANGLFIDGNGNTVRNLVINRFNGRGIVLNTSNNNTIQGNYIGTSADGTTTSGFGNSNDGIYILSSQNNQIGGTTGTTPGGSCTGMCNLISGNAVNGINFETAGVGSDLNIVEGNYIGTDVTGTVARGNGRGIRTFNTAQSNRIGGTTPSARNIISGNGSEGIGILGGGSQFTIIEGNYIGVNVTGNAKIPNGYGIRFVTNTQNLTIGGTTPGAGNLISGNSTAGIYGGISGSTIQGNIIGTDPTGTLNLSNGTNPSGLEALGGISLLSGSSGNTIGGTAAGAGNIVAFNRGAGIRLGAIQSLGASGAGNSMRGNSVYLNDGLGISLSDGGGVKLTPLANDTLDPDTGANNHQNYPVISSVSASGGTITVTGTLNSLASTSFSIDFYASENQDSSGSGEGQTYVGTQNVTTDGSGNANISFNYAVIAGKPFTTATATNQTTGDTSEFSNAFLLAANPGTFVFSSPTYSVVESAGTATITVTRANGSTGTACVNYATSNGTATANSDYTPASGQLCFADGETSKSFTVTINEDAAAEPDETINLTLSNPTGGSALGLQSTAVLTIINNDSFQILVVNSIADTDDGACTTIGTGNGCTLREAINAANATASQDSITFDIGTGTSNGTPTITVTSVLPAITAPVIIDGNTGGATRVEINGNNVSGPGLNLGSGASRSTIRRLVINRFNGTGISIGSSSNNVIEGNYIGTDSGGVSDLGNTGSGITFNSANNNRIGGTSGTTPGGACTGACNLISGNNSHGISADPVGGTANANVIQGNFIGTDVTGMNQLGNSGRGITFLNGVNNTQIGGTAAAARNLISGNNDLGVFLSAGGTTGNLIRGNYIGVNTTATAKLGNLVGVTLYFTATGNTIGGTDAGAGNVISGNVRRGIEISTNGAPPSFPPNNNIVQGNFIGTDPTGTLDLGNGQSGITVEPVGGIVIIQGAFNNQIGGTSTGAGNTIAFNYGAGIRLGGQTGAAAAGSGNSILNNSIYSNNGLGIALGDGSGVLNTPLANDTGDADTGANNRQNYPVLSSAVTSGGTTAVQGSLNSTAGAVYRLQFFSSPSCDSSGSGEGRTFLGELAGTAPNTSFTFNSPSAVTAGQVVTATATNQTTNDTSEFSACTTASAPPDTTPPIVTSIDDGDADDTVIVGTTMTYTVSFNEDILDGTVTAADFDNAGTSLITIGTITEVTPGIFTVQVTPTSAGTLQLRIPSGADIRDTSNNALVVPVTDDTTVSVNLPNNFTAFVVTKTADTADGACDADCSLREAITAANGDAGSETITFSIPVNDPGYDAGTNRYTINLTGALPSLTGMTITGTGANVLTVRRNTGGDYRIFDITDGETVAISGITVSNGNTSGDGGGIQNGFNAALTLTNAAVSGNTTTGFGGGIYNLPGATLNVINSTISGNIAKDISGNGNGGGIAVSGTVNITNSTISKNFGGFGGGIITFNGTTLTVTSSTISSNSSLHFGGGIANQGSATAYIRNTIIADNTAVISGPDISGTFNSLGFNLIEDTSDATINEMQNSGTNITGRDPVLGPLQNNGGQTETRALLAGSPAIDKGNGFGLMSDQRGSTRPVDLDDATYPDASDAADIGAYEAQTIPAAANPSPTFIVTSTADPGDGVCDADCTLREAITAANGSAGPDIIGFNIAGTGPHTIQLTAALPNLAQSVDILNNSGKTIIVRGEGAADPYGIFIVNSIQTVSISNLVLTNGYSNSGDDGGGGILNSANAILTITGVTVSGNTSTGYGGGGIFTWPSATLNVINSTISGNTASGNGIGGGIAVNGTVNITNSTISGNSAQFGGGVITSGSVNLTITGSTIVNNSSQNFGGGIAEQSSGATIIRNTIVANNTTAGTGPDISGTVNSQGYNLIEDTSGATINETQNSGTNITGQDPVLGPLQNNGGQTQTHALSVNSPAIDKGRSFGLTTDQRGSTRPVDLSNATYPNASGGDGADIGAFELQTNDAQADLSVSKTDSPDPVSAGSNITYTITAANNGSIDASNVTLTDILPAGTTFVSLTQNSGPSFTCSTPSAGTNGTVSCTIATLSNAASASFTLVTAVASTTTNGAVISNTATISSSTLDPVSANNSSTATTTVAASADLSVTKADSPDPVTAGNNLTYTLNFVNNGASDAQTVTITDAVPANTTFVSAVVTTGTAWTVTNPAVGGTGNIVFSKATVSAGETAVFTISVKVNANTAAGTTITNSATAASATTDPNSSNNTATATTTVAASADLSVTKTDTPDPVTAGNNLTYTITATNAGPSNAASASLSDTLSAGTTFVSLSSPGGWSCTTPAVGAGGTVSCSNSSFAPGSAVFTLTAAVAPSVAGGTVLSNTVTVTSSTTDPTPGNNAATATTTVAASADLAITKTDGVTSATPGGSVTYTITASNSGPSNAAGAHVADTFPATLTATWTCTGANGGTCTASGSGNINDTANLPVGGSVTYTVSAAISAAATGTLSNTATVTAPAGVTDPTPGNNSATDTDTLSAQADLSITKTDGVGGVTAGSTVTYTIVASNSGPSNAPGSTVADVFPASLTNVTWTCAGTGGGTCTASGSGNINDTVNLPSGGSVTYTVTAVLSGTANGTLSNTATVTAPAGVTDPNPANNSATDTDAIGSDADLSVTKSDAPDPVIPGNNIAYAINVSNAGPAGATSATLSDVIPANTTYQSITAPAGWTCTVPAVNSTGTVSCSKASMANGLAAFVLVVNVNTGTASGTVITNTATVSSLNPDPAAGNNSATTTTTVAEYTSPAPTGQAPKAMLVKPATGNATAGGGVSDSTCTAPAGVTVAGTFANINQALGAANVGDTIYVCPKYTAGAVVPYIEQVSLGFTNLSVVGISDARGSRAVIAANPSTLTSPTTQLGTNYIVQIVATGVNFGNFVVDGAPAGTNFANTGIFNGIAVRRSGAFVFNNTVQNIKTADTAANANGQSIAIFGAGTAGNSLEAGTTANPVNILNNVIQTYRSNGVSISAGSSSAYAFVRGNYIIGNGANSGTVNQSGVQFLAGANGDVFNNRITRILDSVAGCSPAAFSNCSAGIRLNTTASSSTGNLRIRYNQISNTQTGIFAQDVQYVSMTNNTISHNVIDGINLRGSLFNLGSNFNTINQNTIFASRRSGIFIGLVGGDASLGNNLTQNTIEDAFTGVANNPPVGNNTIPTSGITANTFISVTNFVGNATSGVNDVQNTNPLP